MTEQALKALKESIEHWEKLAAGVPGQKIGADYCPLCAEFNFKLGSYLGYLGCTGCPVKEKTGQLFCKGTPWDDIDAITDDHYDEEAICEWLLTDEAKALAAKELAFLKSLLP